MRPVLLLLAMSACTRESEPVIEPQPARPLALSTLPSSGRSLCVFSQRVGGPAMLIVREDGRRLVGLVQPKDGTPVALTMKVTDDAVNPTAGVQMKGPDITVAIVPAAMPGVPVGTGGVRRPATLTAATVEGASVELAGVWSCARPAGEGDDS